MLKLIRNYINPIRLTVWENKKERVVTKKTKGGERGRGNLEDAGYAKEKSEKKKEMVAEEGKDKNGGGGYNGKFAEKEGEQKTNEREKRNLFIIYLSRVLCLSVCVCVCVTFAERSGYSFSFSNQTDQGDETEGLEREG